ncbi:long-chain-acyl-CoA synthetase [Pseudomonas sp. NCCP-436]|uniref:long-chain-acyl-CoA synthetase n=1 Tax=Pseudomonas sp. NCCP-436 TaxID=2842481 RepID=UPI001C824CE7|nr:long-chain-acyl-CoA synthetase [Pseudomonas sp. NCCP-436]GIZ12322.1 long-chain-acyl-CoA synthetase [Pseudomonas sp. NCCP-436]
MCQNNNEFISLGQVLHKTPQILRSLPRIIRGLRLSNNSAPGQPCGLGLTFEQAAQRNPDGVAVLYEDRRYSYRQFNQRANQIAHYLAARGIGKGDVVGVFLENRPELLVTVLALAKLGAISAMLNTSQTQNVLLHSINLVKPVALVIGEELLAAFEEVRGSTEALNKGLYYIADQDAFAAPGDTPAGYLNLLDETRSASEHNPATTRQIQGNDPCFYIYTSGTTGLPKAGIVKHGRWMKIYGGFGIIAMDMQPDDVMYSTLPLYHGTGLCVCWGSAIAGASGFAIRRKFSARSFWDDTRAFNATVIGYVGELCRYLLDQPERPDDHSNPVRKMLGNGLRPGAWGPFKERFGVEHVCEFYAASEGNIGFSNVLNFDNTIGFSLMPWALVEYDRERGEPVRDANGFLKRVGRGEPGLLLARVDEKTPLDGYTDPEQTRKVILENVFEPGDRYFNTGDMLRSIGFGHAQFVDRLGDTFRWKGENVSTTEVENLLIQHPRIAEVVVYGVDIPNTNGCAGMAAITLQDPHTPVDMQELLSYARRQLPPYAVPLFLRIKQSMETTGTFKYQKKALKQEAFDPRQAGDEPVYAWLPGSDRYVPVNDELFDSIIRGQHRY